MRGLVRLLGWSVLLGLVAFVVARFFLLELEELGHDDMAPTLLTGDQIAVFTRAAIERGDVAVCEHPREPGRRIVGRVLGMAGDKLAIVDGVPRVNGVPLSQGETGPEPPAAGPLLHLTEHGSERRLELRVVRETLGSGRSYLTSVDPAHPDTLRELEVESGYYLLSDNRHHGTDSRTYGEVHPSLCKGVAFLLLLPGPGQGIKAPSERRFTRIE